MPRLLAPLAMLAFALLVPASALAQDPPAEVPDIAASRAAPVTSAPSRGIATAAGTPQLWATVNVCDTAASPNSMGVRAGMPGNASGQRMFVRFRAERWSRSRQDWAPVGGAMSPWVKVGPARYERRQAGWTFQFDAPATGVTVTMRAIVDFQWRRPQEGVAQGAGANGGRASKRRSVVRGRSRTPDRTSSHSGVVRTVTRATQTGIAGVAGGDPAGTSKALCLIY